MLSTLARTDGKLCFIHMEPAAEWELNIFLGDEMVLGHFQREDAVTALLKVLPNEMMKTRRFLYKGVVKPGFFINHRGTKAFRYGQITDGPSNDMQFLQLPLA
jgi:hypothetical protein